MGKYVLVLMLTLTVFSIIVEGEERVSRVDNAAVNMPTYNVAISKYKTKLLKECRTRITVSGRGIGEVYSVPCSVYGLNIITNDKVLVVHNRDERHPLILFSDTDSDLFESVENNECTKITYRTVAGKTTSTEKDITKQACQHVLYKVALEERKATNPLKETKRKMKLAFQRMFPPEFFEALKTDKPAYHEEYSPGWNTCG